MHAIAFLKLLGAKISLTLDSIEAWKKYKLQDHSLFIRGGE